MSMTAPNARTAPQKTAPPSLANDWQVLAALAVAKPIDIASVCATTARIMAVSPEEVGFLKVRGLSLEFVFPFELKSAGRIPLSSSAVAARTVTAKKPEVFNDFANVVHNSVFELVPLGGMTRNAGQQHIQKLMSFPVLDSSRKAIGVIQISRKGHTRSEAGPDFTNEDMEKLAQISQLLSFAFEEL